MGNSVTITAIPNSECYEFSHWEGACDGSDTECQLVMDETKEL
ncbi:InlB B-repeat-containing protein [Candidatus Marithrix sp. Canyon 246]